MFDCTERAGRRRRRPVDCGGACQHVGQVCSLARPDSALLAQGRSEVLARSASCRVLIELLRWRAWTQDGNHRERVGWRSSASGCVRGAGSDRSHGVHYAEPPERATPLGVSRRSHREAAAHIRPMVGRCEPAFHSNAAFTSTVGRSTKVGQYGTAARSVSQALHQPGCKRCEVRGGSRPCRAALPALQNRHARCCSSSRLAHRS